MTIKILISALCLIYIYVTVKAIIQIKKNLKREDEIIEQLIMELVWSQQRQESIEALEQEQKRGKWETVPYKRQGHDEVVIDGEAYRCTNCGNAEKKNEPDMNYCPNCGARMESDRE